MPNGQFGSRLQGGKDSASERYIYTRLSPETRQIFSIEDDPILEYLDDDGTSVEPIYYIPIIPLILVNGGQGIGTGFSSEIQSYKLGDIISRLKQLMNKETLTRFTMIPYYKGFKGTVSKIDNSKFLILGCYENMGVDKIKITELPIGCWTLDYKSF